MPQPVAIVTVQGGAGLRAQVEAYDPGTSQWHERAVVDLPASSGMGRMHDFRLGEGEAFRLFNFNPQPEGKWVFLSEREQALVRAYREDDTLDTGLPLGKDF